MMQHPAACRYVDDRHIHGHTGTHTDRQTDRRAQTDRQTDRQAGTQAHTNTHSPIQAAVCPSTIHLTRGTSHVCTYFINSADPGPASHQQLDDLDSAFVAGIVQRGLTVLGDRKNDDIGLD